MSRIIRCNEFTILRKWRWTHDVDVIIRSTGNLNDVDKIKSLGQLGCISTNKGQNLFTSEEESFT